MKSPHTRARFAGIVALSAMAHTALGDSPCYKDYRDTTPAEQSQVTTVLKALQAALPPAPEGWFIVVDTAQEISVPSRICRDTENAPWSYGISRTYKQATGADARMKLIEDQVSRQQAAMQQAQPRMDAALGKYQKIMAKQMELNQKGDYAGAEKLTPQLNAAQKEYEAILEEAQNPAAMAATDKEVNRDFEMSIRVSVNPGSETVGQGAKAVAAPAHAKSAQRWHVESEQESTDHALYLFGAWTPGANGKWNAGYRAGAAPAAPHAISVLVRGDPERVAATIPTLKFPAFEAAVR